MRRAQTAALSSSFGPTPWRRNTDTTSALPAVADRGRCCRCSFFLPKERGKNGGTSQLGSVGNKDENEEDEGSSEEGRVVGSGWCATATKASELNKDTYSGVSNAAAPTLLASAAAAAAVPPPVGVDELLPAPVAAMAAVVPMAVVAA
eukprot:CAMPEP_0171921858 /NCGR_PEP_ID=MMETSP0993-20121228/20669_1 /TAXON_ID=483369 /ORGANISM="non described non described, Strain CCMP2098" /LENGTH=147 /DNA_ID=CAMNT_0012559397 /DNA_START=425 /DNA_END=868 /DNA_ORIENTATION=-